MTTTECESDDLVAQMDALTAAERINVPADPLAVMDAETAAATEKLEQLVVAYVADPQSVDKDDLRQAMHLAGVSREQFDAMLLRRRRRVKAAERLKQIPTEHKAAVALEAQAQEKEQQAQAIEAELQRRWKTEVEPLKLEAAQLTNESRRQKRELTADEQSQRAILAKTAPEVDKARMESLRQELRELSGTSAWLAEQRNKLMVAEQRAKQWRGYLVRLDANPMNRAQPPDLGIQDARLWHSFAGKLAPRNADELAQAKANREAIVANMDREVAKLRATCDGCDYTAQQRRIHAEIQQLEARALVP